MKKRICFDILLVFAVFVVSSCCTPNTGKKDERSSTRAYNGLYTGENLNRVAFPIGGLGAGMFCLEGTGAFSQVSVRNAPNVFNEPLMFAAISVKGKENGAKVLEGPIPEWKYYGRPNTANGGERTSFGLPRFKKSDFQARFPFATIHLSDSDIPVEVTLTGWSPFVPTDADNSSLPAGAIEYTFTNTGSSSVDAVFSFHSTNFMKTQSGENSILPATNGFVLSQNANKDKNFEQGDFCIFTDQPSTVVNHCWFRGGWWDPLTIAWKSIAEASLKPVAPVAKDAPGASLYVPLALSAHESKTVRLMLCWYVPNSNLKRGTDPKGTPACDPASGCCSSPYYQPWYSGKFASIAEVANYWKSNYDQLKSNSTLFTNSFFDSTLPPEVLEAVSANLSILKSPTVLRQRDGKMWAWKVAATHGAVAKVRVRMCGIMHRPSLIYSPHSNDLCEQLNLQ